MLFRSLRLNLLDVLDKVQWETGALAADITPEELYDVSCQDILNTLVLEQGCLLYTSHDIWINLLSKKPIQTFVHPTVLLSYTNPSEYAILK